MELKDTVELMLSDDYEDRFKAELMQLNIRRGKLADMLDKWDRGELDFEPKCSRETLGGQLDAMDSYMAALAVRAQVEGIDL